MSVVNNQLVTPPNSTEIHRHREECQNSSKTSSKSETIQRIIKQTSSYLISLTNVSQSLKSKFRLNHFLTEILKRSRASLPIFQIALRYYLTLTLKLSDGDENIDELVCIKKRFLVCLILSFKYHFDCQYSFQSWAKISGLTVKDLQRLEVQALKGLDYRLSVSSEDYESWINKLALKMEQFQVEEFEATPMSCCTSFLKRTFSDINEFAVHESNKRFRVVDLSV